MFMHKLLEFTAFELLVLNSEEFWRNSLKLFIMHQRAMDKLHIAEVIVDEKQQSVDTNSQADIQGEAFHTCTTIKQIYNFWCKPNVDKRHNRCNKRNGNSRGDKSFFEAVHFAKRRKYSL